MASASFYYASRCKSSLERPRIECEGPRSEARGTTAWCRPLVRLADATEISRVKSITGALAQRMTVGVRNVSAH